MTIRHRLAITLATCALATAVATAVPAVVTAENGTYVVQPGDSLSGIAAKSDTSIGELLDANGLALTSVILPGQRLIIPGGDPSPPSSSPSGQAHTVVPGDSLSAIASRYGVSLASLLSANSLTIASVILPGDQLTLPAGASSPAPSAGSPSAPSAATHTVVGGDSLSGIASRYGVSLASLLSANSLTIASVILPGQHLTLPAGASTAGPTTPAGSAAPEASQLRHTVGRGDSLSGIASRYGVSLASLLSANGLTITSVILPGDVLALPAGATAPAPSAITSGAASPDTRIAAVVDYALAQQGKPYEFFSKGPFTFDCSGLTLAAYAKVGISLIHYSAGQALQGVGIDISTEPIKAGDLIFQMRRGSETINHVGMAVSATTWIQAIGTGEVVRVGPIPAAGSITAVRRLIDSV